MLSLNSVNVSYGKVQIINNVSIEVPEKQVVALLGSNGAGKTTIMRTIAGLIKPMNGEIVFQQKRIDKLNPANIVRRGISMVPEERQIFNQMSVIENLLMGAFIRHNKKEIKTDLELVFSLFPVLGKRKDQAGGTLSGGEQQMLSIGRALMAKPKILLLDEPSMGIAPILVETIFNALKKVNLQEECPILLVEQNARKALSIADYAYVIECGSIVLEGPGVELKEDINVKKAYLGEE